MIKSVVQLKNVQMPFAIENVLTARVDLPRDRYPDSPASIRFFEQLLPAAAGGAGRRGGHAVRRPAGGRATAAIPVQIEGKAYPQPKRLSAGARRDRHAPATSTRSRRRLLSGREFTPADIAASQPVAIVNESFARDALPGRRRRRPPDEARSGPATKEPWLTIVGVVPDLLMEGIGNNNASPVGYYIPIAQSDVANGVRIAVRTRGEPRR